MTERSSVRLRERIAFLLVAGLLLSAAVFIWTSPDNDRPTLAGVRATDPVGSASVREEKPQPVVARPAVAGQVATPTVRAAAGSQQSTTRTVVVHEVVHEVVVQTAAPAHTAPVRVAAAKPAPVKQVAPTPKALVIPTKAELLDPSFRYDGVSTPQAPYDFKDLEIFESAASRDPNLLSWYAGWDVPYDPAAVTAAWSRGMLPMITWEPRPNVTPDGPDSDPSVNPQYTLESIIDGSHDAYIRSFAQAVAKQGYPIVLRFAHEMNGNWYPWSEQVNGNQPGQYVQAWRHVHDLFTEAGANNVIWLWSPNIDTWCGTCNNTHSTPMSELYPGAAYVDWVGLTGYYRKVITNPDGSVKPATFANTFGSSMAEIEAAAPGKRVLLAEVGATEVGGQKANWMTSVLAEVASDPDLLGLVWFDHSHDGNDWRIESSYEASEAWAAGVADPAADFGEPFPVSG